MKSNWNFLWFGSNVVKPKHFVHVGLKYKYAPVESNEGQQSCAHIRVR